jgi:hypothetical protein
MFNAPQTPCPITNVPAIDTDTDPEWHNVPPVYPDPTPTLSLTRQNNIREMWQRYAARPNIN